MNLVATNVNVVCLVCLQQHIYPLSFGYWSLTCPLKRTTFEIMYAKTRAKNQHTRSRQSRIKVYQIRLILPNKSEKLITFQSRATHFELRAGDSAIVAYYQGRAKIVQNCTINQYMTAADGCFIATAVYGSYEADEVLILRKFRDHQLASSKPGQFFIHSYYFISPPIANLLEGFPIAKRPIKHILNKIVQSLAKTSHSSTL